MVNSNNNRQIASTMEFLLLNKLLVFLIDVIAIWLGGMVLFNNPRKKINQIFILMVTLMLSWVNFAFFARIIGESNFDLSSLFLRIAWFVTPIFFVLLYFLVLYLLDQEKEYRFLSKTVLITGGIVTLATGFTDLIINNLEFIEENLTITYGVGMFPFLGVIFFLICATLYPLIKAYLKSTPVGKGKIEYFLVGIFIFYLGNFIFNITFPIFLGIARFYWLGDYSAIFLMGFTGFAIVRRELFGVRVILTQLLVGAIAVLLLWQAVIEFPTNWMDFSWKLALFLLFLVFGYFLIQNVIREIQRRAELQRLYEEVDRLSRAKSEFISIASHQLRTPLTAIKGYISMLIEGTYGKLADRTVGPMEKVYRSNERLIKLVNDLLNVSRIEAGTLSINFQKTSLENIISSTINELKIKADERKIYLKRKKPEKSLPDIMIDSDKFRQVILNIIDNSIKYTEKGGIIIETELKKPTSKWSRGSILIEIKDTGEGMTKEEIEKMFESFSRGKAGEKHWTAGAGLGLYIAKKFTEIHEGRIWVESEGEGKGSAFYIELPVK